MDVEQSPSGVLGENWHRVGRMGNASFRGKMGMVLRRNRDGSWSLRFTSKAYWWLKEHGPFPEAECRVSIEQNVNDPSRVAVVPYEMGVKIQGKAHQTTGDALARCLGYPSESKLAIELIPFESKRCLGGIATNYTPTKERGMTTATLEAPAPDEVEHEEIDHEAENDDEGDDEADE